MLLSIIYYLLSIIYYYLDLYLVNMEYITVENIYLDENKTNLDDREIKKEEYNISPNIINKWKILAQMLLNFEKEKNVGLSETLRQVRRSFELEEKRNLLKIKMDRDNDCHHESIIENRLRNNSAMSFCGDISCGDPSCKAKTREMYSSEYEYD